MSISIGVQEIKINMSVESRSKSPNKVSEFILQNVPMWDDLNAPTLSEGKQKYKDAVVMVLQGQEAKDETIGFGGGFLVQPVAGREDLVLKRLHSQPNKTNATEWFEERQAEHAVFEEYFGDFVSPAEFAVVPNKKYHDPDRYFYLPDEYVVIQERVYGEEYIGDRVGSDEYLNSVGQRVTPRMRQRVDQFVDRYQQMVEAKGWVPENQLMFDFKNETMWVVDTNDPFRLGLFTEGNFYMEEGQDTKVTPQTVVDTVTDNFYEYHDLKGKPWSEVQEEFTTDSDRYHSAYAWLEYTGRGRNSDFNALIHGLQNFPPEGENMFIRKLREFGIASPKEQTEEVLFDVAQDHLALPVEPQVGRSATDSIAHQEAPNQEFMVHRKQKGKVK